jgi:hypothetical protein
MLMDSPSFNMILRELPEDAALEFGGSGSTTVNLQESASKVRRKRRVTLQSCLTRSARSDF